MKGTFARMYGLDAGQLQALAKRLERITFSDENSAEQVLSAHPEPNRLSIEAATRRKRDVTIYDPDSGNLSSEERFEYRRLLFQLDTEKQVVSTPGARRDFKTLADLLKRCGIEGFEHEEFVVDVLGWARELLKMYDTAQLENMVIADYYTEPKLLGRYQAKSMDNRIDLAVIPDMPGRLKSIKFKFYHYQERRSVEARADGVVSVTSTEDDELGYFYDEQARLMLKHAEVAE